MEVGLSHFISYNRTYWELFPRG